MLQITNHCIARSLIATSLRLDWCDVVVARKNMSY